MPSVSRRDQLRYTKFPCWFFGNESAFTVFVQHSSRTFAILSFVAHSLGKQDDRIESSYLAVVSFTDCHISVNESASPSTKMLHNHRVQSTRTISRERYGRICVSYSEKLLWMMILSIAGFSRRKSLLLTLDDFSS